MVSIQAVMLKRNKRFDSGVKYGMNPLTHSYLFGTPKPCKSGRVGQKARSLVMFNSESRAFYRKHKVPVLNDNVPIKTKARYSFTGSW